METYYKYHIVFALIVISMLILNPMTVHSQSLTIQGSERSEESEESERTEESERSEESEESERTEESESTTATKPGEETPMSISIEPHCIDDILATDCIPVCPPDCLSGEGIRLTIDTGDGNPKTIRGDKDQILEQLEILAPFISPELLQDIETLEFEHMGFLKDLEPLGSNYDIQQTYKNPGVSINCKVSATDIGTDDTDGTLSCAFINSYPIKWEGVPLSPKE